MEQTRLSNMWYVLLVAPQRDAAVAQCLTEMDHDAYSPLGSKVVIHKRYKTRLHKEFRLFPGYVFVTGALASAGIISPEAKRAGAREYIGPFERPFHLPFGYVEHMRNEELLGTFDSRKRPEVGAAIRLEIFGVEVDAEVIRSPADTIHAIANLMGRMVTITDCAGKLAA